MPKRQTTINRKIVARFSVLVSVVFLVVLSVTIWRNVTALKRQILHTHEITFDAMIEEGLALVRNNSIALRSFALGEDFDDVRHMLTETVEKDPEVQYCIFMDPLRLPAVYVHRDSQRVVDRRTPMEDYVSVWAYEIEAPSYCSYMQDSAQFYEFAAPVRIDEVLIGTIRYGYNTTRLRSQIDTTEERGRRAILLSVLTVVVLYLLSMVIGYFAIGRMARGLTRPLAELTEATKRIAEGDYNRPVTLQTNDEVGQLAAGFDTMRRTVKRYTDDLEKIIDEKMRQVNDILGTIDQGLFTVNTDGSINEGYSARANTIFGVTDISKHTIDSLFRLTPQQAGAFTLWLGLVASRHGSQRWEKLVRLCPVHRLNIDDEGERRQVAIDYRKVLDSEGRLSKVMVLATDCTEQMRREEQLAETRRRLDRQVQTILAIAHTPPDELAHFMDKAGATLESVRASLVRLGELGSAPEGRHTAAAIRTELARDIHTLKGTSGSLGFEELSAAMHRLEDGLAKLEASGPDGRKTTEKELLRQLDTAIGLLVSIGEKATEIFGEDQAQSMLVPSEIVDTVLQRAGKLAAEAVSEEVSALLDACNRLSWKPLATHCRRYRRVVTRAASATKKKARLVVLHDQAFYPDTLFSTVDDILMHLVNNAVAHGIESPERRRELDKTKEGKVMLSASLNNDAFTVTVGDDGAGIDTERIARTALKKGLVTPADLERMTDAQRTELIFAAGFSTNDDVDGVAGRGVGLDAVMARVKALGGTLEVDSVPGMGAAFVVSFPRAPASVAAADTHGTPDHLQPEKEKGVME